MWLADIFSFGLALVRKILRTTGLNANGRVVRHATDATIWHKPKHGLDAKWCCVSMMDCKTVS